MLRSQRIPAKLEIGYSGDIYHAWISVYIKDIGWIDKTNDILLEISGAIDQNLTSKKEETFYQNIHTALEGKYGIFNRNHKRRSLRPFPCGRTPHVL